MDELCAKIPTPFHLYHEGAIRQQCRNLKRCFGQIPVANGNKDSGSDVLPGGSWVDANPGSAASISDANPERSTPANGYTNFFAVKATPTPAIMEIMKSEGFGADCSSMAELILSEKCGFRGDQIMFTSNNTPRDEYEKATELGAIVNFDDLTQVEYCNLVLNGDNAPKQGQPPANPATHKFPELICFRFNPGPERTGNVIIGDPKEAKYGVSKNQLFSAFTRAKQLGAKRFGLHTMVISNCTAADELVETARMCFQLAVELFQMTGIAVEFINLGGGVGIPYRPEQGKIELFEGALETPVGSAPGQFDDNSTECTKDESSKGGKEASLEITNPTAVGPRVAQLYRELVLNCANIDTAKALQSCKVVTECGRYLCGPCGALVTRLVHKKAIYKNYLGVDACMANLMRPGMYGAYHHVSILGVPKERLEGKKARVTDTKDFSFNLSGTSGMSMSEAKKEREKLSSLALLRSVPLADNSIEMKSAGFGGLNDGVFDVVGGLCENNDKFAIDRRVVRDTRLFTAGDSERQGENAEESDLAVPQVGDLVFVHDAGAHGHSMGFQYNGKLRSCEILLKETTAEGSEKKLEAVQIRRAETYDDLFACIQGA